MDDSSTRERGPRSRESAIRHRSCKWWMAARMAVLLAVLLAVLFSAPMPMLFAGETSTPVDHPFPIVAALRDGDRIKGSVTAFDSKGFQLEDAQGRVREIAWKSLRAKLVYDLHGRLLDPGAAAQWMALGQLLRELPDGWKWSNYAFGRAANLDPSLKDRVTELVRQRPPRRGVKDAASTDKDEDGGPSDGASSPGVSTARAKVAAGGQIGRQSESSWPKLTDRERDEAIARAKAFAERAHQHVSANLAFYDTRYFLFFTDLDRDEAVKWQRLLDRMYDRMCEMFAVPAGTNIWLGKASVYVFKSDDDYRKFEDIMFNTPTTDTAGRCHANGRGDVTISFYRQPDDMTFATILVHESTHGFLHRYRSAAHVRSWANEGLAEWVAADLVPQSQMPKLRRSRASQMLRQWRNVGPGFFTADQIDGDQYGIAYTLTDFLIGGNRAAYVSFINGCKDGMDPVASLEQSFGTSVGEIIAAYGRSMGVDNLSLGN